MEALNQKISFDARLEGMLNHSQIQLAGGGSISHPKGQTIGDYELRRLPEGFSPFILSACLITGYPNASKSIDGSRNIFQGRSYNYTRTLKFRTGEEMILDANCSL